MTGNDAVGGDRAGIDDPAHAGLERGAKDVLAAFDVHLDLHLALSAFGDEEGEVDEHVATFEVPGEARIADVGLDGVQLGRDRERRAEVEGPHVRDGAVGAEPAQDERAELAGASGDGNAHRAETVPLTSPTCRGRRVRLGGVRAPFRRRRR